jgi:hypothetical protein
MPLRKQASKKQLQDVESTHKATLGKVTPYFTPVLTTSEVHISLKDSVTGIEEPVDHSFAICVPITSGKHCSRWTAFPQLHSVNDKLEHEGVAVFRNEGPTSLARPVEVTFRDDTRLWGK